MALDVRLFPCLGDNYGFLCRDTATGLVATVDTPDAQAILKDLDASGWGRLDLVLNTHWHPDHTQGNAELKSRTGCEIVGPEEVRRAAPIDQVIGDGDTVALGETVFEVVATPGHTLGHVVYREVDGVNAFVGDALFVLGCGRMFEGDPESMWAGLQRLAAWPAETTIWCAHEYTLSNARFARSLDAGPELAALVEALEQVRAEGRPTVPTTMSCETRFNPFLKAESPAAFAQLRAAKDTFAA